MTFSETFLVFLVIIVVFLGVKFGFRKPCLCKRNDKYKVCRGPILCAFSLFFSWPNEKASRVFLPWEELFSPDTDGVAEKKSGICRIVCLCFSSLFSFKICQILCTDYLGSLIPHTSSFVNHVLRLPFSLRFAIPSILHSVFMHCLKFAWAHWQGGNKW